MTPSLLLEILAVQIYVRDFLQDKSASPVSTVCKHQVHGLKQIYWLLLSWEWAPHTFKNYELLKNDENILVKWDLDNFEAYFARVKL